METIAVPEGYQVVSLRPDQWEELSSTIFSFYWKDEPLINYIGLSKEEFEFMIKPFLKNWFQDDLALGVKTKDTETFVGFLIGCIVKKVDPFVWGKSIPLTEKGQCYTDILRRVESEAHPFDHFGVDVGVEHSLLTVHEDHRGRGLSKFMAQELRALVQRRGYKLNLVNCVNIFTSKSYEKLGFQTIYELGYDICSQEYKEFNFDLALANGTKSIEIKAQIYDS